MIFTTITVRGKALKTLSECRIQEFYRENNIDSKHFNNSVLTLVHRARTAYARGQQLTAKPSSIFSLLCYANSIRRHWRGNLLARQINRQAQEVFDYMLEEMRLRVEDRLGFRVCTPEEAAEIHA